MSAPFEFSYQDERGLMDLNKTPELGRLISEWVDTEYGADHMVMGILAFDEDKSLAGIRVEAYGPYTDGEDEPPTINGREGELWDESAAWVKSLGVEHVFTFVRRTPVYPGGAQPNEWDTGIAQAADELADDDGLVYQGHLITNGSSHGMLAPGQSNGLSALLRTLGINPLDIEAMAGDANSGTLQLREGADSPFDETTPDNPDARPNVPPAFYN